MQSLDTGTSPNLNVRVPRSLDDKITRAAGDVRGAKAEFVREALRMAVGEICCLSAYWGTPQACRHEPCKACGEWTTEAPDGSYSCGHTKAEKSVGN